MRFPRSRNAFEQWDRVEGFDSSGRTGTIVKLASDTVTVQPDVEGAQRVVLARVGSTATIILPVLPAALPGA